MGGNENVERERKRILGDEFLDVAQAAKVIGIDQAVLRQCIDELKIAAIEMDGDWKVPASELRRFMDESLFSRRAIGALVQHPGGLYRVCSVLPDDLTVEQALQMQRIHHPEGKWKVEQCAVCEKDIIVDENWPGKNTCSEECGDDLDVL